MIADKMTEGIRVATGRYCTPFSRAMTQISYRCHPLFVDALELGKVGALFPVSLCVALSVWLAVQLVGRLVCGLGVANQLASITKQ